MLCTAHALHDQLVSGSRSVTALVPLPGQRDISGQCRDGCLLRAQPLDIAVDRVAGDLPPLADLERVDLAGGDEVEHEGPAYAEQVRCFFYRVHEPAGGARGHLRTPGHGGPGFPGAAGLVRGPPRTGPASRGPGCVRRGGPAGRGPLVRATGPVTAHRPLLRCGPVRSRGRAAVPRRTPDNLRRSR